MSDSSTDLPTLLPSVDELALSVASVLHVVLVVAVLVLVVRRRVSVPYGLLGYVVLLALPVLGPLLVLNWNRLARRAAASTAVTS